MTYTIIIHNDNPDFISNVEKITQDRIHKWKPTDIYVTRIDNWFDNKWLKFSGTIRHEIAISQLIEVTVPPFHPNRVESCDKYIKQNEHYIKTDLDKPLHISQASNDNLKRKIADFSGNGLYIWFSSKSKTNNNGSLMGYYFFDNECFTFYASLTLEKNWKVSKSIGMTKKDIDQIISATEKE